MAKSKRLLKFKDAHTKEPVYINIDDIFSITRYTSSNINGTTFVSNNGFHANVEEHISEVLALIEDRDPMPARVLHGRTDND